MAFKILFIQACWCLTGVDSYTILETKKLEKLVEGILLYLDRISHMNFSFLEKSNI